MLIGTDEEGIEEELSLEDILPEGLTTSRPT